MTHPAGAPPAISGFSALRLLGSGGFADVFLYQQQWPRREVAVKVLRDRSMSAAGRQVFESEANLMAGLAAHPHIVTVLAADLTLDGRPYLVMEYYPGPSMGRRYRERVPAAEALRIAIQITGAVESAHRHGVLHLDIKPANILTSALGHPGLADFGISVVKGQAAAVQGMSIPWSPPELLDGDRDPDERSDVWSLAATLHSLLAGRSPFEVPGGDNGAASLTERIHHAPPRSTGRPDVPPSLERLLQVAMSKKMNERPASALHLGLQLQAIEAELGLDRTRIDVLDAGGSGDPLGAGETGQGHQDPGSTRLRPVRLTDADTQARGGTSAGEGRTRLRPRSVDPIGDSPVVSPPAAAGPDPLSRGHGAGTSRSRGLVVATAVVAVTAVGGAVALAALGSPQPSSTPSAAPSSVVDPNAEGGLEAPGAVTVKRAGVRATVSWARPPDWRDGDWYVYALSGDAVSASSIRVDHEGPVALKVPAEGALCIKVSHRRDSGESPFAVDCVG